MNLKPYYIPALIGAAALGAIWYLSRQAGGGISAPAPSTAGNDTISPGAAGGATPSSVVTPGSVSPGSSAANPNAWGLDFNSGW